MKILIIDDLEGARVATEGAAKLVWQDAEVITPKNLPACREALSEGADLIFLDVALDFPGESLTSGITIANEVLSNKGTRILINSSEDPQRLERLMIHYGFTNYMILVDTPKTNREGMQKFLEREKTRIVSGLKLS